jgi:hypothetical protein
VNLVELLLQALACLAILHLREEEEMGPSKVSQRFPQDPSWQEVMIFKTEKGVDKDDVQIPMELKMLIAIVQ